MVRRRLVLHINYVAILFFIIFARPAWSQENLESTFITKRSATENNEVFLQTTVNKNQLYVQEALIFSIKLYYTLAFERGASFSRLEMSEAAYNKLGDDLNYTETVNGVLYTVNESRFVVFPQSSGEFTIAPIRFRAFTQTRATRNNTNLQTTEQRQTIELLSQEHQILVLAIPNTYPSPNWIPSSDVKISESWSRPLEEMRIGDSVVRTVQLEAEGIYASMLVNLDFTSDSKLRYYPAEAQQVDITENSGVRSVHTQNITLVATEAGKFTLPAVEIPWWNTTTNNLEYARLPAQDFDILTVDGQRIESEYGLDQIENTSGKTSSTINLNLLLFISVILLVSVLFFGPALLLLWNKFKQHLAKIMQQTNNDKQLKKLPNINSSFQKLKQACVQKDIQATAEYLLSWGQAYFQNAALYNLDKLDAAFNQPSLKPIFKDLQTCLYAESVDKDIDFEGLLEIVSIIHKNRKTKLGKNIPYNLPPLYRN